MRACGKVGLPLTLRADINKEVESFSVVLFLVAF